MQAAINIINGSTTLDSDDKDKAIHYLTNEDVLKINNMNNPLAYIQSILSRDTNNINNNNNNHHNIGISQKYKAKEIVGYEYPFRGIDGYYRTIADLSYNNYRHKGNATTQFHSFALIAGGSGIGKTRAGFEVQPEKDPNFLQLTTKGSLSTIKILQLPIWSILAINIGETSYIIHLTANHSFGPDDKYVDESIAEMANTFFANFRDFNTAVVYVIVTNKKVNPKVIVDFQQLKNRNPQSPKRNIDDEITTPKANHYLVVVSQYNFVTFFTPTFAHRALFTE
ncbi:hypothetical protein DFA_02579 [Cavenderia fasciculata]|uniref:Uncharacterized protein n=1 Tax=Cavenderia fasciculata TaxID=261658 RepID=F4PZS6_CACFS|nr:uncharacterized protein DFA_02579 [Cavenderia fasciculata]EGG18840.1 hypothetical protein DFA_02579 [Cavenderia fasciculata]|eukprot:XP_004357302.1 hypothetical protein DFA_02579 [Cavenderia fasciculata]